MELLIICENPQQGQFIGTNQDDGWEMGGVEYAPLYNGFAGVNIFNIFNMDYDSNTGDYIRGINPNMGSATQMLELLIFLQIFGLEHLVKIL